MPYFAKIIESGKKYITIKIYSSLTLAYLKWVKFCLFEVYSGLNMGWGNPCTILFLCRLFGKSMKFGAPQDIDLGICHFNI